MTDDSLPTVPFPTTPLAFLRWFLAAPVRRQTWANLLYLVAAFPLGIAYFTIIVTGFATSGALVIVLVGIPLLVGMVYLVRELAAGERWLADRLLTVDVPASADPLPTDPQANLKQSLLDLRTWTGLAYLISKVAIGIGVFVALVSMAAFSLAFVIVPFNYQNVRVGIYPPGGDVSLTPSYVFELQTWQVGLTVPFRLTTWYVNSLPEALAVSAYGLVLAMVSFHVCNVLAWLLGWYARLLLAETDRSAIRYLLER
jgi:hypothetical protein